ncbi:MAG: hypothetical protein HXY25_04780, partial [Alphaproteobacteria bacterium]|nr:hypothetical protein [Alphaproteobacteria bacterium]
VPALDPARAAEAARAVLVAAAFFEDRRLPDAGGGLPDPAPALAEGGDLVLYGTFLAEGFGAALVGGGPLERPSLLRLGEDRQGLRLVEITGGTAVVEGASGRVVLRLPGEDR